MFTQVLLVACAGPRVDASDFQETTVDVVDSLDGAKLAPSHR
jgi:hypothetical protein